jgi:hypothetical protein
MRWTVVIGIAALFAGGLLGGLIGATWRAEPPPAAGNATPRAAVPAGEVSGTGDATLKVALAGLTREVRRLREALDGRSGEERTSVEPAASGEVDERLVSALESLARALSSGRRPGSGASRPAAPLIVPVAPPRRDLLRGLAARESEERSHDHRFLTYQEVLDRFGKPDYVWAGGRWVYEDPDTGENLEFKFEDGLLIAIY